MSNHHVKQNSSQHHRPPVNSSRRRSERNRIRFPSPAANDLDQSTVSESSEIPASPEPTRIIEEDELPDDDLRNKMRKKVPQEDLRNKMRRRSLSEREVKMEDEEPPPKVQHQLRGHGLQEWARYEVKKNYNITPKIVGSMKPLKVGAGEVVMYVDKCTHCQKKKCNHVVVRNSIGFRGTIPKAHLNPNIISMECFLCDEVPTFQTESEYYLHMSLIHFRDELSEKVILHSPYNCPFKTCKFKGDSEKDLVSHYGGVPSKSFGQHTSFINQLIIDQYGEKLRLYEESKPEGINGCDLKKEISEMNTLFSETNAELHCTKECLERAEEDLNRTKCLNDQREKEIHEFRMMIHSLEEDRKNIEDDLRRKKVENDNLRRRLVEGTKKQKGGELETLQRAIRDAEDKLGRKEEEVSDITKAKQDLIAENDSLFEENKSFRNLIEEIKKALDPKFPDLKGENQTLIGKLTFIQKENQTLKDQIGKYGTVQNENQTLKEKLKLTEQNDEKLRKEIAATKTNEGKVKDLLRVTKIEVERLKKEEGRLKEEIDLLKKNEKKLITDAKKNEETLKEKDQKLKGQVLMAEKNEQKLKEQIDSAHKNEEKLKKEVEQMVKRNEELFTSLEKKTNIKKEGFAKDLHKRIDKLQVDLRAQADETQKIKTQLDTANVLNDDLRVQNSNLDGTRLTLLEIVKSNEKTVEESTAKLKELSDCKNKIVFLERENHDLKANQVQQHVEVGNLKLQNTELTTRTTILHEQHQKAVQYANQLLEERNNFQNALTAAQTACHTYSQQVEQLVRGQTTLQTELGEAKNKLKFVQDEMQEKLAKQQREHEDECKKLKVMIVKSKSDEEMEVELKRLQREKREMEEKMKKVIDDLDEGWKGADERNEQFKKKIESLEKDIKTYQNEVDHLRQELEDLQNNVPSTSGPPVLKSSPAYEPAGFESPVYEPAAHLMDDTQNVQKEELDFLKDMNEKLIQQMEKLDQEKAALAEKLKEPEQVPGLRAKIQKLSDDHKQLIAQKDRISRDAERTKADLKKEVDKLKVKVEQKQNTIDDLVKEMSKEGKSAKELQLNTKKETDELKKKVGDLEEEISDLKKKETNLKENLDKEKSASANLKSLYETRISNLQVEVEAKIGHIADLNGQIKIKEETITDLQDIKDHVKDGTLECHVPAHRRLEKEVENHRANVDDCLEVQKGLEEELEHARKSAARAEQSNRKLKALEKVLKAKEQEINAYKELLDSSTTEASTSKGVKRLYPSGNSPRAKIMKR